MRLAYVIAALVVIVGYALGSALLCAARRWL